MANALLPRCYSALIETVDSSNPRQRFAAMDTLAWTYALIGLYEDQVALDRKAVEMRPDAPTLRRRLAFGLLKLGRRQQAQAQVAESD